MKRTEVLKSTQYWLLKMQMKLHDDLIEYMNQNKLNQSQLSTHLKVSKGYISQIINGNSNYKIETMIDILIKIGKIPKLETHNIEDILKQDEQLKQPSNEFKLHNIELKGKIFSRITNNYKSNMN